MTPQLARMICTLIRRIQTLRAERTALMTILKAHALMKTVPLGWKAELEVVRQTEDYRAIVAELDTTISQLEQAADDAEILRLFEQLDESKPPN